jgi:hypothetical protein
MGPIIVVCIIWIMLMGLYEILASEGVVPKPRPGTPGSFWWGITWAIPVSILLWAAVFKLFQFLF